MLIMTTTVVVNDEAISGLTATNDSPSQLGTSTTLTATTTSGSNINYTWDFGDESAGVGQVVSHSYQLAGIYTASVAATNSNSMLTTTTTVIISSNAPVLIDNYLPIVVKPEPSDQ
jgi:PKD repeat protein